MALWTKSYSLEQSLAQFVTPGYSLQSATTYPVFQPKVIEPNLKFYLGVYFGTSLFIAVLAALRYLWIFQGCISASQRLFGNFTYALLHAPLRWLDTVPLGRVLNRFTADFSTIDSEMGPAIANVLNFSFRVLGIAIAGYVVTCSSQLASHVL